MAASDNGKKKAKNSISTARRQRLVEELANPQNKSIAEAGRKAGFSAKTVRGTIYGLVKHPGIAKAVEKRINRAIAHHQVTREEVIGGAVFQMRSSMDDLIDKDGRFDIKKARRTGAIDLLKKIKITETVDPLTQVTTIKHEIEIDTPSAGRKEVANYIGVERFGDNSGQVLETFKRICNRIIEESVLQNVSEAEMAKFFVSDERAARMDEELIRMIEDRFLK